MYAQIMIPSLLASGGAKNVSSAFYKCSYDLLVAGASPHFIELLGLEFYLNSDCGTV
jgi:hypothetical protein